ncbi:MAG: TIGR02444 family protein [Hyphomonadaceae bacterium]
MADADDLWDWAVAAYGAPGVAAACLDLQDRFGASVTLLLWAAHAATEGRIVSRETARMARKAVAPLAAHTRAFRAARRALAAETQGSPKGHVDNARRGVEAAERAYEKLELARLALHPAPAGAARLRDNLLAMGAAEGLDLGQPDAAAAMDALAQALAAFTRASPRA